MSSPRALGRIRLAFALAGVLVRCTSDDARRSLPLAVDASVPPQQAVGKAMPEPAPDASTSAEPVRDASPPPPSDDCIARQFPIALVSTRSPPSTEYELYVMSEDGAEVRRIGRGGHFTAPVWSPSGDRIAFHHVTPQLASYFGVIGTDELISVPLSPLLTYPPPPQADVGTLPDGPSWSRDGSTLAFALPSDSGRWHIELMASSGGQQRALLPDLEPSHAHPSFAHKSDRLAYVQESDEGSDIWLVDVNDPSQPQNLSEGRVLEPARPRWSPDDTRIAFSARDPEGDAGAIGESEIFVLTVATGAVRRVTEDQVARNRHPTWSPDGESLLYSSERGCATVGNCVDLFRVRLDGSEAPVQLTFTAREIFPDWFGGVSCPRLEAP
jgi:Tol biopolymer transport system component